MCRSPPTRLSPGAGVRAGLAALAAPAAMVELEALAGPARVVDSSPMALRFPLPPARSLRTRPRAARPAGADKAAWPLMKPRALVALAAMAGLARVADCSPPA